MGAPERREREKQQVRDLILEAARELFVSQGYDAVTMRQIAHKIEYTPTAIYFHFKDKQELINELCAIDFLALARTFQHLAGVKDPLERLKRMAHEYIDFGLKNPNHYRLLFMTPHPYRAPQENQTIQWGNPAEDAYAFLRSNVIECIAAGYMRDEFRDPELMAQLLWSAVHGVTALQIARRADPWVQWRSVEDLATALLESQLRGFLSEAGRKKVRSRESHPGAAAPAKKREKGKR